jgi:hypothetical protein
MRFVLQVYFNGAQARLAQLPEAERRAIVDEYIAFFDTPAVQDGNQLQSPATAMTVRVHDGQTVAAPGPFAAGAEPLGGYYLVEADDLDAAVALAARVPAARMGGAVEVRPVVQQ